MKPFSGTLTALVIFIATVFLFHGSDLSSFIREQDPLELQQIRSPLQVGSSSDGRMSLVLMEDAPRAISKKIPDHRRRLRAYLGRSLEDWDLHVFIEQSHPRELFRLDLPYPVVSVPDGIFWEGEHILSVVIEDVDGTLKKLSLNLNALTVEDVVRESSSRLPHESSL